MGGQFVIDGGTQVEGEEEYEVNYPVQRGGGRREYRTSTWRQQEFLEEA